MADCAAAPSLNDLRLVHPFEQCKHLVAYAARLAERPSFARALQDAAPMMARFMGG
jgi:glutathione S-transferase